MRKYLWQGILLIALVLSGYSIVTQKVNQKKIVYVNSSKLLDQYQGMVDARAKFKVTTEGWKAELDTMYFKLTKQIETYEKNVSSLSPAESKKQKELIEFNSNQLQKHQNALNDKATQENDQMTKEVIAEVNTFINEYCKKKKYLIVLGVTAEGNLVYANEKIEITDEIIIAINRHYRGE